MKCEPRIFFMCDECGEDFDFAMTSLATGSWDDRGVARKMERDGWVIEGDDRHICPDCVERSNSDA